jgi:dCMP deaminase
MKINKLNGFMEVARHLAMLSNCYSRNVGCILLDAKGHIKATGYNGPPSNMGDCPCCHRISGEDLDLCPAVHAEQNAIMQCHDVSDIKYCLVTTKPCRHCIKMLLNTSVEEIYYLEDYPHNGVTELWESAGRSIQKMDYI